MSKLLLQHNIMAVSIYFNTHAGKTQRGAMSAKKKQTRHSLRLCGASAFFGGKDGNK
ncbi:MAG: hypothetical protein PHG02_00430 [Oscillospiraceae bacterium]|nr:hypothetical protein [Oscillospiraceae bacterium]